MSPRPGPPEQWITVPVPALVSAETFAVVQERLRTNQHLARRNVRHHYLLRGLVSCGTCRLSCTGRRLRPTDEYQYYVCRGKLPAVTSSRPARCPARLTPAAQLDALVWADVCLVLQQPDLVRQALTRARTGAWVPEELQRRQASLCAVRASLSRQQDRLLEAYLAGVLDLTTFEHKRHDLQRQEAEMMARERELVAQAQRVVDVNLLAASTTQILTRLAGSLDSTRPEQRRQLVELLIDRVVVTDGDVKIRYVIPTTDASTQTPFCQLRTDYFDPFPDALADGVAGVAGRPPVDGAPPLPRVPGDVRRGPPVAPLLEHLLGAH